MLWSAASSTSAARIAGSGKRGIASGTAKRSRTTTTNTVVATAQLYEVGCPRIGDGRTGVAPAAVGDTVPVMLQPGDKAPDFTLLDQDGNAFPLSDSLRERKRALVYFYPKADTPGCTKQACGLNESSATSATPSCSASAPTSRRSS